MAGFSKHYFQSVQLLKVIVLLCSNITELEIKLLILQKTWNFQVSLSGGLSLLLVSLEEQYEIITVTSDNFLFILFRFFCRVSNLRGMPSDSLLMG